MTRKRILVLLGSVCLALMMVAMACAGPAPSPTPSPSPSPSPTPSPTSAPSPTEEVYKWRLQTTFPPLTTEWQDRPFVEDIYQMSGGRIEIDLYPDGALVSVEEMSDALAAGVIEMMVYSPVYAADKKPVLDTILLPFSRTTGDEFEIELNNLGLEDLYREAGEELGMYYISTCMSSDYFIITTDPAYTLDDLREMKLRAAGAFATMFGDLGISATYYPASEFYTNLSRGIIDGLIWAGAVDYDEMGLFEQCKYIVRPSGLYPTPDAFWISLDIWNSLPEDLQGILRAAALKTSRHVYNTFAQREWGTIARVKAELGVQEIWLPEEDQKELLQAAMKQWDDIAAKSPRAAEAVEIIKSWLRTLGKL